MAGICANATKDVTDTFKIGISSHRDRFCTFGINVSVTSFVALAQMPATLGIELIFK